ncbi:MAG TPA: hypothetical protein VH309_10440 [Elusimicrobiota bacterium]|nr:hypothetical protein [Elusimicrobiota bacterium]
MQVSIIISLTVGQAMTARKEDFSIAALVILDGIDEATASLVSAKINEFDPDYWLLFQPDSYIFFFREKRNGKERSVRGVAALKALKNSNIRLGVLRIGQASGPLVADFSWFGRVKTPPFGTAANEAHKNARSAV